VGWAQNTERRPWGYIPVRPDYQGGDRMSRRIRVVWPKAQAAAGVPPPPIPPGEIDTYFDKVVKYIPADIVSAWVAVTGLVSSARDLPRQPILWVAFAIGLILTAWWTWKQAV